MAEEITKNNKKRKSIKIIFLAIILLTLANLFAYPVVAAQAKIYLSLKYKESPTKFELVDHNQSHVRSKEYAVFFTQPVWIDFSFEYKYNDRLFFVNRDKGRFYDDYQLEDIENWCTEWLKENVDKRIVGIPLDSYELISFQKSYKNNVLTKNEIKTFLYDYFSGNLGINNFALFYDESIKRNDYSKQDDECNKIDNSIRKELKIIGIKNDRLSSFYLYKNLKHNRNKYVYSVWDTFYLQK